MRSSLELRRDANSLSELPLTRPQIHDGAPVGSTHRTSTNKVDSSVLRAACSHAGRKRLAEERWTFAAMVIAIGRVMEA